MSAVTQAPSGARTTTSITPASERNLRNHVSIGQSISNSLTMAYRGLLKIKRTPEQLQTLFTTY